MTAAYTMAFRLSLVAFPAEFRRRFSDEMESVFADRCQEQTPLVRPWFVAGEIFTAAVAGTRLRIAGHSRHETLKASVMIAMLITTLTIRGISSPARIDFSGHDPAGLFTIAVVDGKAIAATLNKIQVAPSSIIQRGDSISILGERGNVALAVQFHSNGEISWMPRQ
jgi:hypothetical protein